MVLQGEPAPVWIRRHRRDLVERALRALAEQGPTGAPEPERRHDQQLRWIVGHNIDLFVAFLGNDRPIDEEDAPDLVASAARRASEGSAIEELLHDYQVGIAAVWQACVEIAAPAPDELVALTAAVQTYLLQTTRLVLRGFQHEASRISMGERDARFALFSALLNGEDAQLAAQRSGLHLASRYLVLRLQLGPDTIAATTSHPAGRAVQVSEHRRANTVQRVLTAHADGDVLALVRDPLGTALVPLEPGTADDARERCRSMAERLVAELDADVHVSAHLATPPEVPAAAALTDEVLELVLALDLAPGAWFLEDVTVPYQLTRPGPAATLLEARMRPLDSHPDWEETLRTYVRHDYDRRATAAALHLHPNTVDYRLGRIAASCGFDPSSQADRALAFASTCLRDLRAHRSTAGAPSH